ncbi:MAG TPA: chloride channel protein [Candidatus Methylomirabilis sp.]|nr:chloride channel protein [Candidatus Methylomirabilis sp.]
MSFTDQTDTRQRRNHHNPSSIQRGRTGRRLRVVLRSAWRSNRVLGYAVLVGVLGGIGAQIFIWMLNWGERIFLGGIAGYVPPAMGVMHPAPQFGVWTLWLLPLTTTLGGLLCGLLVYSLAPEAEGHGTDAAIASYHFRGSRVRPIVPVVKAVASAITIGSGGAGGREGPAAQISSGAASLLCDILKVSPAERRMLVLAGMAAGLSAIFRAPLGMAIFAGEILYAGLAFEFEALQYTLISAVVAYAVNGLIAGWAPLFLLPSNLTFTRPVALLGYAILGVVAGIVGALEPPIFYGIRDFFSQLRVPRHVKPAIGGLLMGLVAMVFPQTLSTGFGWVQMALSADYIGPQLLLLPFAKILAMSFAIASGGSGGVFGPNVYIGAMVGGAVAYVMDLWFPAAHFVPAAFVVVGMGAVFAGTARVPLSTLIMVAEMTGGYGLIVPSMLASVLSFTVQRTVGSRFRYSHLYESQVEGRLDSPVHHQRLVQGALQILEAKTIRDLPGISLPDLSNLLRFGQPINIHGGKGRIFAFALDSEDGSLVGRDAEKAFGSLRDVTLIAIVRSEEVLPPGQVGPLEQGDRLIIAASEEAYGEFLRAQAEPGPTKPAGLPAGT